MEILKLYEKAASELDKAISTCAKSDVNISSITLILSDKGTIFTGLNWKRLNDSLSVEETCSEYEAIIKLLLAGESGIDTIITLNAKTKLPVNPCSACQELIIKINPDNKSCKVVSGKNSQVILTSLNNEYNKTQQKPNIKSSEKSESSKSRKSSETDKTLSEIVDNSSDTVKKEETVVSESISENTENASDKTSDNTQVTDNISVNPDVTSETEVKNNDTDEKADKSDNQEKSNNGMDIKIVDYDEPENEPLPHSGIIDTAGLKMIFDDWDSEKSPETSDTINIPGNKPFNVNSLSSQQIANTPLPSDNQQTPPVQQPVNNFYQQPVNNNVMYQQQQPAGNGMYQQQPTGNGMYQQQPASGLYQQQPAAGGMYQQQPVPGGMMYQQQQPAGNGIYQQQPVGGNGMYQQQPAGGMYQQQPAAGGMYQQQPAGGNMMYQQQSAGNGGMFPQMQAPVTPDSAHPNNSVYLNQQPQQNNSLYMNQIPQQQNNTQFNNQIPNYQNPSSNPTPSNSTYINKMQAPITNTNIPLPSQSVYGTNINSGDNNAIFKDRLNNILTNSTSKSSQSEEDPPIEEAMKSIKDKKKAAKIDAKFIKRQKKNGNL